MDKPIECSECKKDPRICYREILLGKDHCWVMCDTCPVYQGKLQESSNPNGKEVIARNCSFCSTSLQDIQTTGKVGGSCCYTSFPNEIFQVLVEQGSCPQSIVSLEHLNKGKEPGKLERMRPSVHLMTLNEALQEALNLEDYEQAATLRDQITALKQEMQEDVKEGE